MRTPSLLECAACAEPFDKTGPMAPIALHCGHSVSKRALTEICAQFFLEGRDTSEGSASSGDHYSVNCPTCNAPTQLNKSWLHRLQSEDSLLQLPLYVSSDGLDSLEIHQPTISLIERMDQIRGDTEGDTDCDLCASKASFWCEKCEACMCEQCDAAEHVTTLTQRHQRVPVATRPPPISTCDVHPGFPLVLYCDTCSAFACEECAQTRISGRDGSQVNGPHAGEGHAVHPLDVIVNPRRAHCQQQADGIAARCKLLEQLNSQLRERITLLDDEAETALQMAEREFGKLDEILRTAIQARSSRHEVLLTVRVDRRGV